MILLIQDGMLTCKFTSDLGIINCSRLWQLVFFERCCVKLTIRYQAS